MATQPGVVETQGTRLYFKKPGSPATLVKMTCPTGVSGLGGPRDNIVVDCLENTGDRFTRPGSGTPGQVSVPFSLVPTAASHQDLFTLKEARTMLDWIVVLSDAGSSDPSLDSDDAIEPPSTGTSFEFIAYIADVAIDIASNTIVTGTLTLQRSGKVTPHWPS